MNGNKRKLLGKRGRLIALLVAFCTLAAGCVVGVMAAKGHAATRKTETHASLIRRLEEKESFASYNATPTSSALQASLPGIVSISPAPGITGINTTASIATYGKDALTFHFSAPEGLQILPFLFRTSTTAYWDGTSDNTPFYPANSNGQGFNATQIEEAIASGNYVSSISVESSNSSYKQPIPLLGGVQPETGKVVSVTSSYPNGLQLSNSPLSTKGISIEQYFQKECNADATFTEGSFKGKSLSDILGVPKAELTPEACDAIFHEQLNLTVSFGGKTYNFSNPQQVGELIKSLDTDVPSTNFTGYNGPAIDGPMQINASLTGMAVYFLGLYFGVNGDNTTFAPTINLWPSTKNTGALYSAAGAQIQVSSTVEGQPGNSYTYTYQLFGNASDNFYSSSAPASDFASNGLLSADAPAGPLGLYFNAVSQTGQPFTQVQVALQFINAFGNGLSGLSGSYLWPAYWNPSNVNDQAVGGDMSTTTPTYSDNGPNSLSPSPSSPSSPYKYYGWGVSANQPGNGQDYANNYQRTTFTAYSIPGHPGCFALSGLPAGEYYVTVFGNPSEAGYQGYYVSTFEATLDSYSKPETFTSWGDPDGFINASADTVIVDPILPNTYFLYSDGKAAYSASTGDTPSLSQTVGSANTFDYQLSTYFSYGPMQLFFQDWQGYHLDFSDMKIAGIPFSVLKDHGASLVPASNPNELKLDASAISYIEENGYLPATPSQPGGTSKIALSTGFSNRTLSVTVPTYLTPAFTSGDQVWVNINYSGTGKLGGQSISQGNYPAATTNGPANDSVPSSLTTSADSSQTGLWFKDLNADGTPSSGAKFLIQNSSGQYLEEEKDSSGAFEGWGWASSPSSAVEFSQRNADAVFSFGGLANGTYTVTQVAWPDSVGASAPGLGTGEQNWPGISPDLKAGGPDWAGYPGHLGGREGYEGSFQVTLSYSSPEAMGTKADPAGLVDASSDSIYALSPVKMAPMAGSSLSSEAYQTETVGVPFTEGWEGYLPMAVTSPSSSGGKYYASSMQVAFPEKGSALDAGDNAAGLEMDNPSTSDIEVAGVPLSTLVKNGAEASSSNGDYEIRLPYAALEYLEENGKNVEGSALSSSSNRLIYITFPAVLTSSFKNGGKFQQWMSMGGVTASDGKANTQNVWWNQNPGSGWGVYSSPLYTNGPASNSLPSSMGMSSNSSETGIWFKSLWWGQNTPAKGAKFTVQNSEGQYLTPTVSNDGTFTGWTYSSSPYDFTEQNADADFSFGGLSDGTYTVTEVNPASGATSSKLSFTADINYSSPESIKAVSDPLNLVSPSEGIVYNIVLPSRLPFTGGRWVLALSISAALLFGLGAAFFLIRKKKKA